MVSTEGISTIVGALIVVGCGNAPTEKPADFVVPDLAIHTSSSPVSVAMLPPAEAARVHQYLDSLYTESDILHSFRFHGEQVDCTSVDAVPSVRAMRAAGMNTTVPAPPPLQAGPPKGPPPFDGSPDEDGNARSCPPGSVPQHRPSVQTIEDAGGLDGFLALADKVPHPTGQIDCVNYTTPGNSWDHAAGYQYLTYQGLLTFTSVWDPYVQYPTQEHSLSQLWAMTGTCEYDGTRGQTTNPCNSSNAVQSLELGWIVGANPYTSSTNPVLYMYVTQNGYYTGGGVGNCWAGSGKGNCCGTGDCFVPWTNAQYVPGVPLTPSTLGSTPNEIALQVWNGSAAGLPAWYVYVNGYVIGYYLTSNTYTGQMQTAATYLQAGGEVYDAYNNNQHTETYMGSGYENPNPNSGVPQNYEWTAYHRHVSYIDTSANYHDASLSYVNNNTGICGWQAASYYGLGKAPSWSPGPNQSQWPSGFQTWNSYFYFGGPGE